MDAFAYWLDLMGGSAVWQAALLTALAGLSTGVGALCVVLVPRSQVGLPPMMAFAAGAMLAVALVELFGQAALEVGLLPATSALLLGALATFALDQLALHGQRLGRLVKHAGAAARALAAPGLRAAAPRLAAVAMAAGPAGLRPVAVTWDQPEPFPDSPSPAQSALAVRAGRARAARAALVALVAVALHNFPEGLVVFAGAYESLQLGAVLAVAIAAHNIPEGMAVAAPMLQATRDRTKALAAGFGSGLCEPAGALVGGLLLTPLLDGALVGLLFAFVAGIMIYVSLDELLPAAREHAADHTVTLSALLGGALMLATLAVLRA